ncbi:hypothetical protein MYX76_19360, partial [Desulfobacterota bacterium AH_259_B03_O07]|nr:hypothetical protein [Desulfobacterota bacterium AH_259_B03_O07]
QPTGVKSCFMNSLCFVNGEIVRGSHACIGFADLGLQPGYATPSFSTFMITLRGYESPPPPCI